MTSAGKPDTDFAMPLAEAMETQRAIRRLRPTRSTTTSSSVARARHQGADRQQPPELGVRGRARPRREAPARPAQPPGLVGLPPARRKRARGDESTRKIIDAVQWQADHFEEVPVVVVPCLHGRAPVFGSRCSRRATTAPSTRPCRTCSWRPGPSASGATLTTLPALVDHAWPAAPSGCRRRSPRWRWSRMGWPKGGYGPTTRRPVEEVVHLDRYGHPNRSPRNSHAPRLRLRQNEGSPTAPGSAGAGFVALARQVTTCREKDELAGSARRAELKQGFDDGLFREGTGTLADVDLDDKAGRRRGRDDDDAGPTSGTTTPSTTTTRSASDDTASTLYAATSANVERMRSGRGAGPAGRGRCRSGRWLRATTSALIASVSREAVEHRDHDVRRVDLEVAPQRGPRVGEAVAVGAERDERLRDEAADSGRAPPS